MISSTSPINPLAAAKLYVDGSTMSMRNSYSVMEKTLTATGAEEPQAKNSVQYQIDLDKYDKNPELSTAGNLIDIYA